MKTLPIFMKLKDKDCLLIGGGDIATRKATLLLRAGAQLTIVAPDLCREMQELIQAYPRTTHIAEAYSVQHLSPTTLVIAATDDDAVNKSVSDDAHEKSILVNAVDMPPLCDFYFGAIVDRDPITIAISSGGDAPVLARQLRTKIETWIPQGFGQLASLIGRYRHKVMQKFNDVRQRRLFWEDICDGQVAETVFKGQLQQAEEILVDKLAEREVIKQGEVYLIGAGPGDPDLMTFKALRLLQKADVVVYDRLVAGDIVDLARRDAERIYVGKKPKDHVLAQQDISQLLVDLAKEGKYVARLKGGDPFIFGRGGEEIELLAEHHIPFQVVPGITAAAGCAAYSGIPLTHRDYAQSVRFLTGHLRNGELDLDWKKLISPNETIVFYMGLASLPIICKELLKAGAEESRPVAVIEKGTTPLQQIIHADLTTIDQRVKDNGFTNPSIIIVGNIVKLHDTLKWFKGDVDSQKVFPVDH